MRNTSYNENQIAGIMQKTTPEESVANLLRVNDSIKIGFTGTDINNPEDGDRLHYIDGDEEAYLEFTRGVWSAVNGIQIGGTDSNGVFISGVSCRQVVNPLVSAMGQEFYPAPEFLIFNWENSYVSHEGANTLDNVNTDFFPTARFGTYSLGSLAGYDGYVSSVHGTTTWSWDSSADNCAFGEYFYPVLLNTKASGFYGIQIKYFNIADIIAVEGYSDEVFVSVTKNSVVYTFDIPMTLTLSEWHYISMVYDITLDKIYITVDSVLYDLGVIGGTWYGTTLGGVYAYAPNISANNQVAYIDETLFSKGSYLTDPDIFIQHYNHNIPWNTNYSAKDLVLKPADGGRVIIDDEKVYSITTDIGYQNGWTAYNETIFKPKIVVKNNICHMTGLICPGTLDVTAFILPPELRPSSYVCASSMEGASPFQSYLLAINGTGEVRPYGSATNYRSIVASWIIGQ